MNVTNSSRSTTMRTTSESLNVVKGTSVLKSYLNGKSEFFSAISDFEVSRMTVIIVNLIATLMVVAAFVAEHSLILAMICVTAAAPFIRYLNGRKESEGNV